MLVTTKYSSALLAFVLLLAAVPAGAEDVAAPLSILAPQEQPAMPAATTVVVRAGEHDDYDRVVFDWPRNVPYTVTRDGGRATIHFSAPGTLTLKPALRLTRARRFEYANDANGNLTVSFELDAKAVVKDFFSGNSIAVDIMAVNNNSSADAVPEAAPEKPAPKPVAVAKPAKQTLPAAPPVVAKPEIAAAAPPVDAAPVTPVAAAEMPSLPPPVDAVADVSASPSAAPQKHSRDVPTINIGTKPVLVASLDAHVPLRAVVWARAGYAYIVFDKKLTLPPESLMAGLPSPLVKVDALNLSKASGFRFAIPDDIEVRASQNGTIWQLFLTRLQPDVPVSATLVAQPDFALGARFILPLPDAPDPVRVTDPQVGDDLFVLPMNQTQAFSVPRRMEEFQLLASAQGMVIKPLTDKVVVRAVSDGIEITSEGGLHLSSAEDTGTSQQSPEKARLNASGKSLFDFASWRGKPTEHFTQARQRLQQTIVDVPERERARARLELARFYFSYGYGLEALGLMNYLAKDIPDLSAHNDFLAMRGAAKITANRPDDGLKDLEASNLSDLPEMKLWTGTGLAEMGNWTEAESKFAVAEPLLEGYPEPFHSRFFLLAIESALAVGNDHEAADWLNQLQNGAHNPGIDPALDYLHGVIHAKTGQAQAAGQAWKLAAGSNDRLYRVRAEMALIDLGVANLSITPGQAADRLEALRFAWRGDDLEVDILHRLGLFYIKAKSVKIGLGVLQEALRLYPQSALAPTIKQEMTQTFHDVFLADLGKNLTPLDALTIYQQYRDSLIPAGEDGIAVTRNLAERLAAIDLMEQAGDLLEDVAKNKLKGVERGKVSARLAAIRLLDRKPQAALDALDITGNDDLPVPLQQERVLLRAKALSQMEHYDDALATLKDDTRFPTKLLRADINMQAKHWEEAAKNLLDLIGPPPGPGEIFSDDKADWMIRCAMAYAMAGDQPGLDRLAIDYTAAMAGSPQNNTFRVLVEPEKSGQLRDIAGVQSRIADVDMFQGFLNAYRKSDAGDVDAGAKKP